MKKIFLYSAAMVAMITSACSSDAPEAPAATDGFVTITASMPAGLNTRSIADGTNADRLQYAVYDVDGAVVFSSAQADAPQATYNNNLTFTLSLPLVKGQTYDMVFWADKAGNSYYTFDAATGDISVDYANLKGNDNDRDAFFTLKENLTVTGAMNVAVELYRPFGQLNIGTADVAAAKRAGIDYSDATVTVKEVYGKLNLISGVASEPADVTFPAATALTEAFPNVGDGKTYTYLSMNYILTGSEIAGNVNAAQKETKDVNIAFADVNGKAINTFDLAAVPFQRNYRTNIFGNLLTSNVDFDIVIKPGFEDPDNNVAPWDGVTVAEPALNPATGNYEIASPAQLAGLAALVNNADATAGKSYVLTADVDLNSMEWTPAGTATRSGKGYNGKAFKGTFDAQGHSVKGLKISNDKLYDVKDDAAFGLFGVVDGGTVKNLVIESADVNLPQCELAAAVVGFALNGATIENVTVKSGRVILKNGAAIAGRIVEGATVSNCSNGADVSGSKANVGGIVGTAYYRPASGEFVITNCTNSGNITSTANTVGGIVGYCTADVTGCTNTGNVTGTNGVGGIAGNQKGSCTISSCVNNGKITAKSSGDEDGAGGIAGNIDYWGAVAKRSLNTISGCINNGEIVSAGRAGGIVGSFGHGGYITGNTNNGKIVGGTTASGVIGSFRCYAHQNDLPREVVITDNKTRTDITGNPAADICQYHIAKADGSLDVDRLKNSGYTVITIEGNTTF